MGVERMRKDRSLILSPPAWLYLSPFIFSLSPRASRVTTSSSHLPSTIYHLLFPTYSPPSPCITIPRLPTLTSRGGSMLEVNLIVGRIKDMQGRNQALRGYL